jgi:hypothetical protein
MRRRGDNCVDDGGESSSEIRAEVIPALNAVATAMAMEVATAMAMATARWWFSGGSGGGGSNGDSG